MLLLAVCSMTVSAVNLDSLRRVAKQDPYVLKPWQATMQIGLNVGDDTGVAYEEGLSWYPLRYAGLRFAVELDNNNANKPLLSSSTMYDNYSYDDRQVTRLNLHPSLAFRAPLVHFRKIGGMLMLECSPGLVMSVPKNDALWLQPPFGHDVEGQPAGKEMYLKNRNGKWLAWRVRTALTLYGDAWGLSLGWSLSNYNLLSGRNNLYYGRQRVMGYDDLKHTNSLFVGLSYCF